MTPDDYALVTEVTFSSGSMSGTPVVVNITTVDDTRLEGPENFCICINETTATMMDNVAVNSSSSQACFEITDAESK